MGFQVRRRTKGKTGWLNFSYSKKRGVGASVSVKFGKNVTLNSRGRLTINFGSGVRYVFYKKKGHGAEKSIQKPRPQRPSVSKSTMFYRPHLSPSIDHQQLLGQIQELLYAIRHMKGLKRTEDFESLSQLYRTVCQMRAAQVKCYDLDAVNDALSRFVAYAEKTGIVDLQEAAMTIKQAIEYLISDL